MGRHDDDGAAGVLAAELSGPEHDLGQRPPFEAAAARTSEDQIRRCYHRQRLCCVLRGFVAKVGVALEGDVGAAACHLADPVDGTLQTLHVEQDARVDRPRHLVLDGERG